MKQLMTRDSPSSMAHLQGYVAPGFEPVRDAFERAFADGRETGAAVAVYRDGAPLVDLWGGARHHGTSLPWEADTPALLFSGSKGLASMVTALAHARGWLDYDARVSDYWPEFAAQGKAEITVRQLLSHKAGLCAIDAPLTRELLGDLDALAMVLARQRPSWTPGTRHGYHPVSIGLYQNELVRRVDPRHRSLGQVLREDVATVLGADFHIGWPDALPLDPLALLHRKPGFAESMAALGESWRFILAVMTPGTLAKRTFSNPRGIPLEAFQERSWLRLEMPAANGIASARGLARAYAAFAVADPRLGLSARTLDALSAPAAAPPKGPRDAVLHVDTAYALGFWKPCAALPFGRDHSVFGAPGAGGSMGFADPSHGLGFAYVPNRMGAHMINDPRATALRDALYRCLPQPASSR